MVQTRTRRHVCFVSVIEGDLATPLRERSEADLFGRLAAEGVKVSMVAVNDVGCALTVDEYELDGLRKAVQSLNVALRVRTRCARVVVAQRDGGAPPPSVSSVIAGMAEAGIGVIHLAGETSGLAVLVDERDAVRTQAVLAHCAAPDSRHAA